MIFKEGDQVIIQAGTWTYPYELQPLPISFHTNNNTSSAGVGQVTGPTFKKLKAKWTVESGYDHLESDRPAIFIRLHEKQEHEAVVLLIDEAKLVVVANDQLIKYVEGDVLRENVIPKGEQNLYAIHGERAFETICKRH